MSWKDETDEIHRRRARALEMGGTEAVDRQHNKGRLTIRERIDALLDPGTFDEIGQGAGATDEDGFTPANYVLGFGRIHGRDVVVGGEDFTLKGGSPSAAGFRKSVFTEEVALRYRVPLVRLHEGAGGSVGGTGKASLPAPVFDAPRFRSIAQCMGTLPVATAAMGAVAGLPAGRLVAAHFSVMSKSTAQVLTAGPAVVERAMGEKKTKDELGGWQVHTKNGTVDNAAEDEPDCVEQIRSFLSYLPQNIWELPPVIPCDDPVDRADDALLDIVPRERRKSFDMQRPYGAASRGYRPCRQSPLRPRIGRRTGQRRAARSRRGRPDNPM